MTTARSRWPTRVVIVLAVAVALAAAGCSDAADAPGRETSATSTTVAGTAPGAYRAAGPHDVGVLTLALADGTPVEVWYPAAAGSTAGREPDAYRISDWLPEAIRAQVPVGIDALPTGAYRDVEVDAGGPFPVVLFSHGFASFRTQSTFLTTHLASWGMVVVAPDHPSRGLLAVFSGQEPDSAAALEDVRGTVTLLEQEADRAGGALAGALDLDRLAIVGHSAGGGTALAVAADPDLGPRLAAYVSLASGALDDAPLPDLPSVFMAGSDDDIVAPTRTRDAFGRAPAPSYLYVIEGAGHLAFADICEIGASRGGVLAVADSLGIVVPDELRRLATDGCTPEETPPTEAWPAIDHFTTAHLRVAFGIDAPDPTLLRDTSAFPALRIEVEAH